MGQAPQPGTLATELVVTGGTASAATELTAFDAALSDAGIHDANLVRVSSVTPAEATVVRDRSAAELEDDITPGAFQPAVYAHAASDEPGEHVFAAVAGVELEAGHGINVELHGTDPDEAAIVAECDSMLREMAAVRDTAPVNEPWTHIEDVVVPDRPDEWASALAAIVYF